MVPKNDSGMANQGKELSWIDRMYQKLENMCVEVDKNPSLLIQETTKYMESQMNSVGTNVRKLCAELIQDLLPPPLLPCEVAAKKPDTPSATRTCDQLDLEISKLKAANKAEEITESGNEAVPAVAATDVGAPVADKRIWQTKESNERAAENFQAQGMSTTLMEVQVDTCSGVETEAQDRNTPQEDETVPASENFKLKADINNEFEHESQELGVDVTQITSFHGVEIKNSKDKLVSYHQIHKSVERTKLENAACAAQDAIDTTPMSQEVNDSSKEGNTKPLEFLAVEQEDDELEQSAHWLVSEDQNCRNRYPVCYEGLQVQGGPLEDYESDWELL